MTALELRNSIVEDIDYMMSDERLMKKLASFVNELCHEYKSTHHKVVRRSTLPEDNMTDEQWKEYFKDKATEEPFESNSDVANTVKAYSGHVVKPMEKWL